MGGIGALVAAKLPEAIRHTATQAIAIVTLLVGISSFGVRYSVHTSDAEADVGKSPMSGAKTKEVRSGLLVQWVNSLLSEQSS